MVTKQTSRVTWKLIVGVAVGAVVVGLLVFLLGRALSDPADDASGNVTDVAEGAVPQDVYDGIEPGADKEQLLERLRPALPVDTRVLARYQERSPETVGSSCVYFEAAGGQADSLYRFCFVEDELVDKTVILPDAE